MTRGQITNVSKGRRLPPLERLLDWAAALSLTEVQTVHFIRLARLAHSPPQVQALVRDMGNEIDRLEGINDTNTARIAHLEDQMRKAGIPFDDPPSPSPSVPGASC